MIGSGVHFYVDNHKFDIPLIEQGYYPSQTVVIKEGANSIILPGVTIGKNSVIGAGSIPVAVGNPARIIKEI